MSIPQLSFWNFQSASLPFLKHRKWFQTCGTVCFRSPWRGPRQNVPKLDSDCWFVPYPEPTEHSCVRATETPHSPPPPHALISLQFLPYLPSLGNLISACCLQISGETQTKVEPFLRNAAAGSSLRFCLTCKISEEVTFANERLCRNTEGAV